MSAESIIGISHQHYLVEHPILISWAASWEHYSPSFGRALYLYLMWSTVGALWERDFM